MADNVFRVEVGAKIGASTATLKKDIQDILDKMPARKIEVTLNTAKSKQNIKAELDKLKGKYSIPVELSAKGTGLNGASGKNFKAALKTITSEINAQQAAKVTLHVDTAATQKAMLAELKKLDLGVNITPKQQQKQAAQPVVAKYGPAMPTSQPAIMAPDYTQAGNAAKNIAFQVRAAADTAALLRQNLQRAAAEPAPDYSKFQGQVGAVVDNLGQMWNGQHQQVLTEENKLLAQAASLQKQIYDLQRQQTSATQGTSAYDQLQRIIEQKQAEYNTLQSAYLSSSSAQARGVSAKHFAEEVNGINKVSQAWEKYAIARARATDKTSLDNTLKQGEKLRSSLNENSATGVKFLEQLDALDKQLQEKHLAPAQYADEIAKLGEAAKKAGAMAESAGQKFSRMLGEKIGYGAIALLLAKVRQALGQVYTNVVNIDAAMTELKKVTDETASAYAKFLSQSGAKARALGSTLTDVVNATAGFARLGYNLADSAELAETAIVYNNVGDGIESIDDATESVISTMQAFNITAQDSMSIADKFNQIGNRFAISSGGVGEAMQRSASAMEAAGNTLDETLALIAAANTVVQNPESVGTSLKTISMYLRAAKTEAEEAGESTDGMAESVSKLREEIKALTGNKVDIMQDDQTFKSTYQILKELSKVWNQISDVSQANILERLAGKRNSNVVSALLNNFDIAEKALVESQTAAGSAMAENEKYLDSINGKLNQLKASWEQLSNSLLSSGFLKGLIDALRTVLDFFNNLDAATNGVSSTLISIVAAVTMFDAVVSAFKFKAADKSSLLGGILDLMTKGSILKSGSSIFTVLAGKVKDVEAAFQLASAAGEGKFLPTLWELIPAAGKAVAIFAAVAAVVYGMSKALQFLDARSHPLEGLRKQADDIKADMDELSASIDTANSRIEELQQLADNGTISIIEQDELDRLKEQNALLQAQLDLKQSLADANADSRRSEALRQYNEFVSGDMGYTDSHGNFAGTSDLDTLRSQIDKRTELNQELNAALLAGDDKLVAQVRAKIEKNETYIQNNMAKLEDIVSEIKFTPDPQTEEQKEMNDIYRQYYELLDRITYSSGEATAAQTIFNRSLQAPQNTEAIQAIKDLGKESGLTKESLLELYKTNPQVEEFLTNLAKFGIGSLGNFDTFVQLFAQVPDVVADATVGFTDLMDSITALTGKYDAMTAAQKEFNENGTLSASTLSSIVDSFGELGAEQVALYNAGIIDAKQMFTELQSGYAADVNNYRTSLADKLSRSDQFYNVFLQKNATMVNELAKAYGEDVKNAKNAEELKEKIRAAALENFTKNYGKALHSMNVTENSLLVLAYEDNATTPAQKARQAAAKAAIEQLRGYEKQIDSFTYSYTNFNASKLSSSGGSGSSSSSKSGADTYQKSVQEKIDALKHQLQMEQITSEQYYDGLEAIEKQYYKDSKAHMTTYASEIRSIDEELFNGRRQLAEDWLSYQEKLSSRAAAGGDYAGQQKLIEGMMEKVKKMISDAFAYGLTEASDYVMELQDKLSSLQDDMLSAVQSPYEKYISYMDDFDLWDDIAKTGDAFSSMAGSIDQASSAVAKLSKQLRGLSKLDVLKQQLKDIDQLYKDGKLSWEKYVDAHNNVAKDIYDTQKNSLQTILDLTMEMIKQEAEDQVDAIEKQVDAYQKIIDLKKQLLQDSADEEDHEEQVAEKVKEIADLQSKIAQLSLDDSREAAAKRASLAEELQQKQKELADLQKDYALDQTIDTLDKSQEAFEDEKDAEKDAAKESVDSWQKLYEKAIKRINGDWDGLYKDLLKYEQEHRDSIDGPDSLVSAWHSATSAMKEYNNSFEDAYKNAPNDALNPNAPNSSEAQSILEQMQSNSAYALLHPGSGLSKKNAQLAEEYYQQTGQKLYYNSSIGWVKDSPTSTTAAYEILGSNAKANPYSAGTAKYRDTNSSAVKWIQYQLKAAGYSQPIDGNYWDTTAKNVAAFANKYKLRSNNGKEVTPSILKYLKAYHTGGIVGNGGELNDHEVLAILKKGEWVLDDTRKQNLKELFANLKIAASGLMSSAVMSRMQTMRPAMVASGGDTFAPHIEVSIQHNGQMTDKDAKQYGNMVANTALEQLRTAFAKRGKV
nr:MAG TPA: minor tail protein [Caudoviricetes sp.]